MKNLIQYLKLWQKKRDELRVDRDVDNDWLDMRGLLDEHMPVSDNAGGASPKKGISLFTTLLITLSAAAMFYVGHTIIETKKRTAYNTHKLRHKKHRSISGADSLSVSDSLKSNQDQISNADSTFTAKNTTATAAASDNGSNKNNGKSPVKADSASNKTIPGQLNTDNRKKAADAQNSAVPANPSQTPDNKNINLASNNGKDRNNTQTSESSAGLSSNLSDLSDKPDKKLNLPGRRHKGKNNAQSPNLLSNSSRLLNNPKGQKPILLGDRDNGKNSRLTKTLDINPNVPADNKNSLNSNNSIFTELYPGNVTPNQHYNTGVSPVLLPPPASQSLGTSQDLINSYPKLNNKPIFQASISSRTQKSKTNPGTDNSAWQWGVLIGANSNGSFTSKNLNKNFYGSLPADVFTGLYGTYNLSPKWSVGAQMNVLSPQIAKGGTYARMYLNYTDSIVTVHYKNVSNSKKIYSIQLPLYVTYSFMKNVGLKAGPVISFPVKQFNTATVTDTTSSILVDARYDTKTDYSIMGGISYKYKRIILEANYLNGITKHNILTDSLIHKGTNNTFQFSIKLQLGGKKK